VIGPLIAGTGNLAGMASPASSALQPNVKRPGYHLSRFVPKFLYIYCSLTILN
jgi:hypothetical protein